MSVIAVTAIALRPRIVMRSEGECNHKYRCVHSVVGEFESQSQIAILSLAIKLER